ncbi:MAG: DUF3531 family protein, partial [Cyanobacteriota bacterium]|nr:DUF3531 family protein [Cyanobacteriota bacterium]
FALDILINAFQQLSEEYVAIEELIIGGQNEDWPVHEDYKTSSLADYN